MTVSAACVSTGGTLQTGRTLDPGQYQVGAGATVPISTRFVKEIVTLLDDIGDRITETNAEDPLTEEEEREAIEAALAILLFQPSLVYVFDARAGIADRFDVGLRYAGPALRADLKHQFMRNPRGDASLFVGGTYHSGVASSVGAKAADIFDSFDLFSYSRRDVDVGMIMNTSREKWVGAYGAVKATSAFMSFETRLKEDVVTDHGTVPRKASPRMYLLATTGGVRVGNDRFEALAELTVSRVWLSPVLIDSEINLDGWIIEPGLGVNFKF